MNTREIPIAFRCEQATLVGIVHVPENSGTRGVISMVAGGPQYRGGCCRQLVAMARDLAAHGTPVMRFDYRGLGDGGGEYRGFEHTEADFRAAIEAFQREAPSVTEIVLWGGCDAASSILIHGWRLPQVNGMILGNPYARTETTRAAVERAYYWTRFRDPQFWRKVVKLQFNPLGSLPALGKAVWRKFRTAAHAAPGNTPAQDNRPFPDKMLDGLQRFQGHILLVLSGRSLDSKEFLEMVARSDGWQRALARPTVQRVDLSDADQAFSTLDARNDLIDAARSWLDTFPPAN
ncbi:MAG: hydrolase 1, exosortase A system-associated [Thiobacillus sp.]